MRSPILLCLLVGVAFAATNPGWRENTEYEYEFRGRSMSHFEKISDDYSGILLRAKVIVNPRADGHLYVTIKDAQYAKVHAALNQGWTTLVSDSELQYQAMPVDQRPFRIVMQEGNVKGVIVSQDLNDWQIDFVKAIASQFQLDTKGENVIPHEANIVPQAGRNDAFYKTVEDSFTGTYSTWYDIHPYPEHVMQSRPWEVRHPELREQNGKYIELIKTRTFSEAVQSPEYHFGFTEMRHDLPSENKMGEFMSRAGHTRAILTGTLDKYIIQTINTIEVVSVAPTFTDKQRGQVSTMLNMTLSKMGQSTQEIKEIENPTQEMLTIVQSVNNPFKHSDKYESWPEHSNTSPTSGVKNDINNFDYEDFEGHQDWHQQTPKINEAPKCPFLPFTHGYQGKAYKLKMDIKETVKSLAQAVAQEIRKPQEMQKAMTLKKAVILSSLLRTMDHNEIQAVSEQLYTAEQSGVAASTWKIYRDAVAEAGTGPALLAIKSWIESEKIKNFEDAQIIQALADSAREPTEEYLRTFYQLVTSSHVMYNNNLNTTALLSFSKLLHEACVSSQISRSKFPVQSFGWFCKSSGKKFVTEEVIPYLSEQLDKAIAEGDSRKVHVYIRSLGNIGHIKILKAFEPYLQNEKHVSQFQRFLMVVALDKLTMAEPERAQNILFRLYENPKEHDKVRVAAVYCLMKTRPSVDILQRMAAYTHVDTSEYVNAAVKTSIESASKLRFPEYYELRIAAEAVLNRLPKKNYGIHFGENNLHSYVNDEMKMMYLEATQTFGHQDNVYPEGYRYVLLERFAGLTQQLIEMQAFVSSVDDLENVFLEQSEEYQKQRELKKQQSNENQAWSSEYIAKLLNMHVQQREQLEGNIQLNLGQLHQMFSFNNRCIEMLPNVLRHFEESLKTGQKISMQKLTNDAEYAVAIPTPLSFSFFYTYDKPVIASLEGQVRAHAEPQISTGEKLQKPKNINAEFSLRMLVSGKTQSQIGFITPFDNQRYSVGYDKEFQLRLPFGGKLEIDIENFPAKYQAKLELEGLKDNADQTDRVLYYHSRPYTAQGDIIDTDHERHQTIQSKYPQRIETLVGDRALGLNMDLKLVSDQRMDLAWAYRKLEQHEPISAILSPWVDNNIQHVEFELGVNRQRSSTKKIILSYGSDYKYSVQDVKDSDRKVNIELSEISSVAEEPLQRQTRFLEMSAKGIESSRAHAFYASAYFQGEQNIKYSGVVAYAKSNADPLGRILIHANRNGGEAKPFYMAVSAKGHFENINELNLKQALEFDPTSKFEVQAAIGESPEKATKIKTNGVFKRSEERKQYLKEHPEVKECFHQMQDGNYQLPICSKMTSRVNLLDKMELKMDYQDMQPEIIDLTHKLSMIFGHWFYPRVQTEVSQGHGQRGIEIYTQFDPDLAHVNASIYTQHARTVISNVPVSDWAQRVFVLHPVYHFRSRVMGKALGYAAYRPICAIDKTAASTFDNKTYPMTLSNDWTVALQYTPNRPQTQERNMLIDAQEELRDQIESYVVLVRNSAQNKREVKIIVQTPFTGQKVVELHLEPSGMYPKLTVNKQEVTYSVTDAADLLHVYQVYGLPGNLMKVEIFNAFYVVYDGERVKIVVVDHQLKGALTGLCGTFTGEYQNDFTSPQGCILREPENFVESYRMQEGKPKAVDQQEECIKKNYEYVHLNIGRHVASRNMGDNQSCTNHQTRYVEEGNSYCFTVRPIPVCRSGCRPTKTITKQVGVHCLAKNKISTVWKSQIDTGANPDFSSKQVSKHAEIRVPQGCAL